MRSVRKRPSSLIFAGQRWFLIETIPALPPLMIAYRDLVVVRNFAAKQKAGIFDEKVSQGLLDESHMRV